MTIATLRLHPSTTPTLHATDGAHARQISDGLGAIALQLEEFSELQYALLGVEAVTVVLGLVIAYVAVQGYRRNESRPMLFVATGFVLLVGVPAVLGIGYLASLLPQTVVSIGGTVSEVLAMASILYGLRAPARE
ncbi:hypothetical protein G9C85_16835 [Halorubellus sp. JP-L1]|uniref:DUF7521 family protein n=1 Tax=Halorubellus sp. JP-L1 TaxID=2715753 RepID=UPI001409FDDD|nr:hypothetical protein [Halorubellus sp. JP-L1]NHN43285.1 hypothetical protein [Halorubellus sp. JP-L1]